MASERPTWAHTLPGYGVGRVLTDAALIPASTRQTAAAAAGGENEGGGHGRDAQCGNGERGRSFSPGVPTRIWHSVP